MIRRLFDTSAYSAFKRGHPDAVRLVQTADVIILCPIVLGELFAGFLGGNRKEINRKEIREFIISSRVMLITMDEETSECYAAIRDFCKRNGSAVPANDLWIGACAMQHGAHVVTSDAHFEKIPQVVSEFLSV